MTEFETYLLVLGLLLAAGALLSGIVRRSILSLAIFFLFAGMVLGSQGFGVINLSADSDFVKRVTELTLIVILFSDGLDVERGMMIRQWHVPLRSLVIAMPVTALLIAAAAVALTSLSWLQALLLGALLSPTDPVLTSTVISNTKIPARVRNSLNLESGFNDGLALPGVLIFAAALGAGDSTPWWQFLPRDLGVGAAMGLAGGLAAVWLLNQFHGRISLAAHYRSLYAFAVALATYTGTKYLGGNGFIAVYLLGIVMTSQGRDQSVYFPQFTREVAEIFKLATFVIFGSLVTFSLLWQQSWQGLAFAAFVLFAVRPLALLPSLAGTALDWPERWFMAWFGPRGVACIAYVLLVLGLYVPGGSDIFSLTALVVFGSIIFHSASDTPLANRFAARSQAEAEAAAKGPPAGSPPARS